MNIAVDMTPYIAGGANGGLVPLLISTIKEIVARNEDEIILITSLHNYDDLSFMDGPRVFRCSIDGSRKSWTDTPVETIEPEKAQAEQSDNSIQQSHMDYSSPAQPMPQFSDWPRRLFLAIKKPAKRYLSHKTYNWFKLHKLFFKRIANIFLHPWEHCLKPILRWIMPHGIFEYHQKMKRKRAIEITRKETGQTFPIQSENKIIHCNSSLRRITGKDIDIFYCPFTAIPLVDESIPVVSVLHDIQHKFFPWFFPYEELQVRDQFYSDLIDLHPQIMAVSEFTKETFINVYHYDQDKIVAIPSSVQNRLGGYSACEDETYLKKLSLTKDSFIFYPANFWPHKNHRSLFVAYSMLCHERADCSLKLVLTGFSGDDNQSWKEAIDTMGLHDEVMFLGYVSDAELAALFRNCKFMVFPSLFEGFGMPITEAMSMGTTVICSGVTSLPEVGGECAFYFDPYNPADICKQMKYVLDHPEEVEAKKNRYGEHLARFSTEAYISKIRDLFIKVIKETA